MEAQQKKQSISAPLSFSVGIGCLLESNASLNLHFYGESNWNTFGTSVWPMLNVSAIIKIHFGSSIDFILFITKIDV